MINYSILLCFFIGVCAGPSTESYKNQFCTDPRTMQKHGAYTEWADAYSCTRHRCQPGGRNLAIYTVGCKHVEAPESAIECEEVVEDTNMQFPFCCTRLRCLVVVRGEVWTRVLGQPWETLPAAPWSHMYKMKKPPPSDNRLLPFNTAENGPVYALSEPTNEDSRDIVMRSVDRSVTTARSSHINHLNHLPLPVRADIPDSSPDIVIALTTGSDKKKERLNIEPVRHDDNVSHKSLQPGLLFDDDLLERRAVEPDAEDTLIPEKEGSEHQPDIPPPDSRESKGEKKDRNLQALVDAIGSRMRDIEHVVKKMSEKVHNTKPGEPQYNGEKQESELELPWRRTIDKEGGEGADDTLKKPGLGEERHSRFSLRSKDKLLHKVLTTELPYTEDANGYFNDASNSVFKREGPSEPALTYMAPVDNRLKSSGIGDVGREVHTIGKKHNKKQIHRKKKTKGHRKRRIKDGNKRKGFNSGEGTRNLLSIEESGSIVNK